MLIPLPDYRHFASISAVLGLWIQTEPLPASRNHWIFKKTHRQRSAFQCGGVTARKEDEGGDLREQQIRFWSRLIMSSEGMSPHGQEGAYEQNRGGPSRAAQQPLLRDLLSSDRKQSQQHGGSQRPL